MAYILTILWKGMFALIFLHCEPEFRNPMQLCKKNVKMNVYKRMSYEELKNVKYFQQFDSAKAHQALHNQCNIRENKH